MAQQPITNKRQRLTKLAKADPYHDFGSVFNSWYRSKQANKDTFLEGLPTNFQIDNDDPQSEDAAFSMVIQHYDQANQAHQNNPKLQGNNVDIDFANLFKIFTYPDEGPPALPGHHMMKINSACKDIQNPAVSQQALGSADPCLHDHNGTNCVYYKKPGYVDLLDKLQPKLVKETDEIEISNFDDERYSVKARNSHIYKKKIAGTIHRTIFRYTEKRLINAYEFLSRFGLLGKKIVLVVDATAISIIEILQNMTGMNQLQKDEVLATRIYFAETVETLSDSATKSSARDGQFHNPNTPHICSCYTASGPVETVNYNWNTHSPQEIGVSGGKKSGGAMAKQIEGLFQTETGPIYQTPETAWPSRYQFEISSRMEPSGKLAASLVVKNATNPLRTLDTIADAEKENNITTVTSKFKKHMGKNTPTDKKLTNIALQQKRSGDWLQVLYCLIAKLRGFKTVDGTPITDIDNVYLLTHDRIALAYGLEMGIDSFFTHGSTGSIWLFEQLRMPEKIARIIMQNRQAYQALYEIINDQMLQPLQPLQPLQNLDFFTLDAANGRFYALQVDFTEQQMIKDDFLRRHTQAAAVAAGAANTLIEVFDELSVFPLQSCVVQDAPRLWVTTEVTAFNTRLQNLFRMLWKINDVHKRHPVLLQDLRYVPFTQPLFERRDAVMTELAEYTGVIRDLLPPQQFPTDDVLLFTETQENIIVRIGEAQAQAAAQAAAPAQTALKRLPELMGQLTECCASVERPLIDMQEKTRLLTLALAELNALDFAQQLQGGTPPEVALEAFDMNKIKSGYPLSRSGPEFSLLGANIISFLPELTSLPHELTQFIDARLEEFLRIVEDLRNNDSASAQWQNAVRAVIRAMRVYIQPPTAQGGAVAVGGAVVGEKVLTRKRQGKKKGNTRKVYRGGNPRIDALMNEFHRQLIKYVFYLIQNLNDGALVELDTSTKDSSNPDDITIYGYKAEPLPVLYKSLIRLIELIPRERKLIRRGRLNILETLPSTYPGCILIIALLELYNEISNQGDSFYDNLDYDIYIDYFLFLYAKLNGKRATDYFIDKVKKLYRIINNKIVSNHFDDKTFYTNSFSTKINNSIIYQANSGYLKELCLLEICKYVSSISIQPNRQNRFTTLIPVFECTKYNVGYIVYRSEYLNLGARWEQINNPPPPPQQNIDELNQIERESQKYNDAIHIASVELSAILGSTDYLTGIHKVLTDCVLEETARELFELEQQRREEDMEMEMEIDNAEKKQPINRDLRRTITPRVIPRGQLAQSDIDPLSKISLGLSARKLFKIETLRPKIIAQQPPPANLASQTPAAAKGGRKTTRKKNIKKYIYDSRNRKTTITKTTRSTR